MTEENGYDKSHNHQSVGDCPQAHRFDALEDKMAQTETAIVTELRELRTSLVTLANMFVRGLLRLVAFVTIGGLVLVSIVIIKDSNKSMSASVGASNFSITDTEGRSEHPFFSDRTKAQEHPAQ